MQIDYFALEIQLQVKVRDSTKPRNSGQGISRGTENEYYKSFVV